MEHLYPLLVHTQHMHARSCLRIVKCVFRWDPKLYQIRCFQTVFGLRVIIYSHNTHYFAIKLSSTAICRCMCSVISGDVSVNTTFINYPFVTMWISPPPSRPAARSSLQSVYIIANHLLHLRRYFFWNKNLLLLNTI